MVNAFRDTISGDFVSGISKLAEALGVAMAIALGVANGPPVVSLLVLL